MVRRLAKFLFLFFGSVFLTSGLAAADGSSTQDSKTQALEVAGLAPVNSTAVLGWAVGEHLNELKPILSVHAIDFLEEAERDEGASPADIFGTFTGNGYFATAGPLQGDVGYCFALELTSSDQLRKWLPGLLEKRAEQQPRYRQYEIWKLEPKGPLLAVGAEWFFVVNSKEELDAHISAFNGGGRLNSDARYRQAIETLGIENSGFCLYLDGPRVNQALNGHLRRRVELQEVSFWNYGILSVDFQAKESNGLLALNQDSKSPIVTALLTRGNIDSDTVRRLPENMLSMFALDLRWGLDAIEAFEGDLESVADLYFLWGMMFGNINEHGDLREAFTGQTVLATNAIDWLGPMILGDLVGDREDIEVCRTNVEELYDRVHSEFDESFEKTWETLSDKLPSCPAAGIPTYKYRLITGDFEIYCSGQHHQGLAPNNPRLGGEAWNPQADLAEGLAGADYTEIVAMTTVKDTELAHQLVSELTYEPAATPLTGCKSNLVNMGTAMEMYSTDWSGRYPETVGLLTPNYLKTIPDCPAAGRDTYSKSLQTGPKADGNEVGYQDYYYLECSGDNHKELQASYPRYNGITGLETGPVNDIEKVVLEPTSGPDEVEIYKSADEGILLMDRNRSQLTFAFGKNAKELAQAQRQETLPAEITEALAWGNESLILLSYNNLQPLIDYSRMAAAKVLVSEEEQRLFDEAAKALTSLVGDFQDVHAITVAPDGIRYRGRGVSASPAVGTGLFVGTAMAFPQFVVARLNGQLAACKSNLKNLGTGLEMYSTDYSGEYPVNMGLLTPNYLRVIPDCPAAGSNTYSESYSLQENPDDPTWKTYEFYCEGHHHHAVDVPANYPRYNGMEGLTER